MSGGRPGAEPEARNGSASLTGVTADELASLLEDAELPALLAALAHLTGDLTLVGDDLRRPAQDAAVVLAPQGGMTVDQQALARRRALDALLRFRDDGCVRIVPDDPDRMQRRLLSFLTGSVDDAYLPMLEFELGLSGDVDAPTWHKSDLDETRPLRVAVIGAGMSGLAMAYRLRQAGIDFVVFERNSDVGGVWLENTYPGCRLDTSNYCYSYSFMQRDDWQHQYSLGSELQEYFKQTSDSLGLREHIRFDTEVLAARYDEASAVWELTVRGSDGTEERLRAAVVVSAVGQLNQPSVPSIPGRESFDGTSFHSARWDHDAVLTGRRVGVIGTGASAYQVVPSIGGDVGELHLFQRTPPWTLPTPTYHSRMPDGLLWLFKNVPTYHRWFRFYQFWTSVEGRRPFAEVDPEWREPGTVSAKNAELRQTLAKRLLAEYEGYPELQAKVVPDYPPYGKRMLRDDGAWSRTLKQNNVHLVTEPIERIDPAGVRTRDGALHELDVLIYCTGFRAFDFLPNLDITGRGGVDLHEQWQDSAVAHLGITVPNFPNLFCIYGPNTNLVVNGSIVMFSECAVHYTLEAIRLLLETGHRSIEVSQDVLDRYQAEIDGANALMAWGVDEVTNWYKSPDGRVSQNWPLSTIEYWRRTRRPDPADFRLG